MAASFFLAFGLGLGVRGLGDRRGVEVAASPPAQDADASRRSQQSASSGPRDTRLTNTAALEVDDRGHDGTLPKTAAAENLVADASQAVEQLDAIWLPAQTDEERTLWGDQNPQVVPRSVLNELRRTGHEIRHDRELWPVRLDNGQRALLPVDRVELHYIGNQYQ